MRMGQAAIDGPEIQDEELLAAQAAIYRLEQECTELSAREVHGARANRPWHDRLAAFLAAFDDCVAACKQLVDSQTEKARNLDGRRNF
jgi:hypothetical protein